RGRPIRPELCASMRSMARWVLPVLVGPSTAVTPAPRVRGSRVCVAVENEMVINVPGADAGGRPLRHRYLVSRRRRLRGQHHTRINVLNDPRTNRGRIADLEVVRLRSRREIVSRVTRTTR